MRSRHTPLYTHDPNHRDSAFRGAASGAMGGAFDIPAGGGIGTEDSPALSCTDLVQYVLLFLLYMDCICVYTAHIHAIDIQSIDRECTLYIQPTYSRSTYSVYTAHIACAVVHGPGTVCSFMFTVYGLYLCI